MEYSVDSVRIHCEDEAETALFAAQMAERVVTQDHPIHIDLHGNLGAGKTTFSRYFIQSLGVEGPVKSPTYTLIEPYRIASTGEADAKVEREILHMDLYRLGSPLELYDLGFLEEEEAIWLIEWPEKGAGVLPRADLLLHLQREGEELSITLRAESEMGRALIDALNIDLKRS